MIRILILLVVMAFSTVSADIWVGGGFNTKIPGHDANETHNRNLSISLDGYGDNPYFVTFDYLDEYEVYRKTINNHYIVAGGKRFIDYEYFFFDFGVAATSEKSIVASSRYLFYERAGLRYKNLRLTVAHWSNAGLKAPNEGETVYLLEYRMDL